MDVAQVFGWLATGVMAGLAAAPHCAGMCGPIAAFACSGGGRVRGAPWRYQLGRMSSYALAGAAVGHAGSFVTATLPGAWTSAVLSWSLAAVMAFAAWRLWRVGRPAGTPSASPTVPLRRKPSKPSRIGRLLARLGQTPYLLGFLTALLPCGALAAALLLAAGTGAAVGGGLVMGSFAVGSSVGLLGAAWLATLLRRRRRPVAVRALAVALMVGSVLLAVRPVGALQQDGGSCCPGDAHAMR
jgi:hypothetical protein